MSEEIGEACSPSALDAPVPAITASPDVGLSALRDMEIQWVADVLGRSIQNLGYPVGMGIAPHPDACTKAATTLVDRWIVITEGVRNNTAPARAALAKACSGAARHASDCALHNAPALPVGPCDCGVEPAPSQPSRT